MAKLTKDQVNALMRKLDKQIQLKRDALAKEISDNFSLNTNQKKLIELAEKYQSLNQEMHRIVVKFDRLKDKNTPSFYISNSLDYLVTGLKNQAIKSALASTEFDIQQIKDNLILSSIDANFDVEKWTAEQMKLLAL